MIQAFMNFLKGNIETFGGILGGIIDFIIIVMLITIVIAIGTYLQSRRRKKKAKKLEKSVAQMLTTYIAPVYSNVIMPDENGETFETDIAFATRKGVFCVECKHHGYGYVSGELDEKSWHLREHGNWNDTIITNPYQQNEGHIRKMTHHLGDFVPYINITVTDVPFYIRYFGMEYDALKNPLFHAKDRDTFVLYHSKKAYKNLIEKLQTIPDILTEEEVEHINQVLKGYVADKATQKRHEESVIAREYLRQKG